MEQKRLAELIEQSRAGDSQAQEELLLAIQNRVYYHCKKMLKKEEDAQDAVQEVLISVLTSLDQLQETGAFWGWVNTITANRCRRMLSHAGWESQIPEDSEGNSVLDQMETLDDQVVPDRALDNAETCGMVLSIIDRLPPEQRMSVLFYYYDEMGVKDIAQAMDVSEGTVKSRLNYARKFIKTEVERLEKQGTKLYGVSVLPFLSHFLRRGAEGEALSRQAGGALVRRALAAAEGRAAAGSGGAGAPAGGAAKTLATGKAAMILAGLGAVGIIAGAVFLSGQDGPEPTPEPTAVAVMSVTTPEPEPTPSPTPPPEPTPSPTPTPTPEPTPSPTPESTPEATPEPTPEPAPEPTPGPTPAPDLEMPLIYISGYLPSSMYWSGNDLCIRCTAQNSNSVAVHNLRVDTFSLNATITYQTADGPFTYDTLIVSGAIGELSGVSVPANSSVELTLVCPAAIVLDRDGADLIISGIEPNSYYTQARGQCEAAE